MRFRNRVIPEFHNLIKGNIKNNRTQLKLLSMVKTTSIFCKNNPVIMFTRADKGNVTVVIKRDLCKNRMIALLNDTDTYSIINKNPSSRNREEIKQHSKELAYQEFYNKKTILRL